MDKPFEVRIYLQHGFKDILCCEMISLEIFLFRSRFRYACKMIDIIHILHRAFQHGVIEQVSVDVFSLNIFQPHKVGGSPDEAAELMPILVKSFCEVTPDKSGSPRDENAHE